MGFEASWLLGLLVSLGCGVCWSIRLLGFRVCWVFGCVGFMGFGFSAFNPHEFLPMLQTPHPPKGRLGNGRASIHTTSGAITQLNRRYRKKHALSTLPKQGLAVLPSKSIISLYTRRGGLRGAGLPKRSLRLTKRRQKQLVAEGMQGI